MFEETRNSRAARTVLLHGFTQTAASWAPLLPYLAAAGDKAAGDEDLVAVDLPGHGRASEVAADAWGTADILATSVGPASTWVGYSLGGRMALHVALAHPGTVGHLALISATAGIADPEERLARQASDDRLAQRVESEGVEAFLGWWTSQPLFATLTPERAGLESRLSNRAAGLASSLRLAGAGRQSSLWERLAELGERRLPVLLVVGELDSKFAAIATAMADRIGPTAQVHVVPGAGHACHLERPEIVGPLLARFLSL